MQQLCSVVFKGGDVDFQMIAGMCVLRYQEFRRHALAQLVRDSGRPPGVEGVPWITLLQRRVKMI